MSMSGNYKIWIYFWCLYIVFCFPLDFDHNVLLRDIPAICLYLILDTMYGNLLSLWMMPHISEKELVAAMDHIENRVISNSSQEQLYLFQVLSVRRKRRRVMSTASWPLLLSYSSSIEILACWSSTQFLIKPIYSIVFLP